MSEDAKGIATVSSLCNRHLDQMNLIFSGYRNELITLCSLGPNSVTSGLSQKI
jgi:hypothetical protein